MQQRKERKGKKRGKIREMHVWRCAKVEEAGKKRRVGKSQGR